MDPRGADEPVEWEVNAQGGVDVATNTLTRNAATTGQWDVGAFSSQLITHHDGYVEFTVSGPKQARTLGLSTGAPDNGPGLEDVHFGVRLSTSGDVFIMIDGDASLLGQGAVLSDVRLVRVK